MENKPKNREWVKTAAIIFLAVLLVLTFFSNTINNRLLPEVATVAVTDGSITAKVRATGKVSAIGNNEVKATGTRTVAAVKVKEGQEVNEGDVLFVMGSAADDEIETATDARDAAYFAYKRAQTGYPSNYASTVSLDRAYQNYIAALDAESTAWAMYAQHSSQDAQIEQAKRDLEVAEAAYSAAQNAGNALRDSKFAEYSSIIDYYASLGQEVPPEEWPHLNQLMADATTITNEEVMAEYAYNQANDLYNNLLMYNDTSSYLRDYQAAVSKREAAESAYYSAVDSYNISAESNGRQSASVAIDVEEAEFNLDKKQAKVDSLSGEGEDANVYAKVSGIVETVNFSSGDTVTKDDVMCIIEVPDQGYTMSASVTKDQASRLKVGDSAAASNYYWGKTITATISSIKSDPKDPQGKRLITFDIDGDVTSGQELTVSVGQKSASYDIIVPKSAVMSDNNGNFVLVITSKSSALGNRYFAKRVDIEVLAEDDTSRAISGDLGNGDFVITNSSTKINSGDQVRLAENS